MVLVALLSLALFFSSLFLLFAFGFGFSFRFGLGFEFISLVDLASIFDHFSQLTGYRTH